MGKTVKISFEGKNWNEMVRWIYDSEKSLDPRTGMSRNPGQYAVVYEFSMPTKAKFDMKHL